MALAALVTCALSARAQVPVGQEPMLPAIDTTAPGGLLTQVPIWLEFGHTPGAESSRVAWQYRLATQIRFYHWSNGISLTGTLVHQMAATRANGLGFDPRGASWEEQLSVAGRAGAWRWAVGVFLRCRHDIDTGAPPDGEENAGLVQTQKRVLILSGTQVALSSVPLRVFWGHGSLRLHSSVDVFGVGQDTREPVNAQPPHWSAARGAWNLTGRLALPGPGSSLAYGRASLSTVLFREPDAVLRHNSRLEGGLHIPGAGAGIDLFVTRERLFDDVVLPTPRAARSTSIGMRIVTASLW